MAGEVLGAAINALGSIWTNRKNIELAHDQMNWNEAMMDKQNDWNLQQYERELEDSSPKAQKQRLLDAGLNPMFYGLDGTGNPAGGLQSAGVQGYNRPEVMNPLGGVDALTTAQVANINADTANKRAQAGKIEAETKTIDQLRANEVELSGVKIQLSRSEVSLNEKQINNLAQQINESNQRIEQMEQDIAQRWKELDIKDKMYQLDQWYKECMVSIDQSRLSQNDRDIAIRMYNAITDRLMSESNIDVNERQKYLIDMSANEKEANIYLTQAKTEGQDQENKFIAKRNRSEIFRNYSVGSAAIVGSAGKVIESVSGLFMKVPSKIGFK